MHLSLEQLQDVYKIDLDKRWGHFHVLTQPKIGQVNGLGGIRGKLVAISDKGLGLLINQADEPKIIHKDWFEEDAVDLTGENKPARVDKRVKEFSIDLVNIALLK